MEEAPETGAPVFRIVSLRPARIEVDVWEQCGKSFSGYVSSFGEEHVLMFADSAYLVGDLTMDVIFCQCPHRFVYEFAPGINTGDSLVMVWRGHRMVIPAVKPN
jgi:hypothetical protein